MSKVYDTISKYVLTPDKLVIDTEASNGSWLVDENGDRYLDCFSQFASQPVGWNHPKVLEQQERLGKVALHKLANSDVQCKEYADFVETFASFCPDFNHFFFISGGALGVENALKAAFDWRCKLYPNTSGIDGQNLQILHFKEAFHGRSGYTLSLTNNGNMVGKADSNPKTRLFPKFKWPRITNPKLSFLQDGTYNNPIQLENECYREINTIFDPIDHNVAAIIVEPIQGEGGDNHFRAEFFQSLREFADKYDVLLIFDEVQTGMGLTGKIWCYEHYGVIPDLICYGKKTQAAGFASTDRIFRVDDNVFTTPSRINSTWGGNLTDMVRSTIYMNIINNDNLIDNAAKVGEYFLNQLRKMPESNISNIRGKGLMIAFDLPSLNERNNLLTKLNEKMLVLPCGERSIRFRPHLTFNETDVDVAIDIIEESIKQLS